MARCVVAFGGDCSARLAARSPDAALPPGSALSSSSSRRPNSIDFRAELARRDDSLLREEVVEWLNRLLPRPQPIRVEHAMADLSDGSILCELANLFPFRKIVYVKSARQSSFQARDNIAQFLLRLRNDLKMKDVQLFEVADLVDGRSERSVVNCLMALSRLGAAYGMDPPPLVRAEIEIDLEEKKEAAPSSGSAGFSLDASPERGTAGLPSLLPSAARASEAVPLTPPPSAALPPSPPPPLSGSSHLGLPESASRPRDNAQEVGRPRSRTVCMNSPPPPPLRRPLDISQPSSSSSSSSPPAEHLSRLSKRRSSSFSDLCLVYVPREDDPTDVAVAAVVNGGAFLLRIRRVRHGVYVVGKEERTIHVFYYRRVCMVRVGGGWESLESFMWRHSDKLLQSSDPR